MVVAGQELFVKDLPDGTVEKAIIKFFKSHNVTVTNVKLVGKNRFVCICLESHLCIDTMATPTFRTCGFLTLEDEMTESQAAELNGLEMDECPLSVELARSKNNNNSFGGYDNNVQRKGGDRGWFHIHFLFHFVISCLFNDGTNRADERNKSTVFVKNLPWGTDEESLKEFFGSPRDVRIPKNDDGKIKGWVLSDWLGVSMG